MMKKGMKLFAAVVCTILLALGISMTALADTGWSQENEKWYYRDNSGNLVKDSWRDIGGKRYLFDSDGAMRYGWHYDGDDSYYLGSQDDGSMKVGWVCLTFNEDDIPAEGSVSAYGQSETGTAWFYFQNNGKAYKAKSDEYIVRTIGDKKYEFDENGAMAVGWVAVSDEESGDSTGISKFKYFGGNGDGAMANGWRYLSEHPSDSKDSDEINTEDDNRPNSGEAHWYYFGADGTPAYFSQNANTMSKATVKVNGENYFFDEFGCMQSGLIGFDVSGGDTTCAYFGESDADGKMRTGRQTNITDEDSNTDAYYFITSGSNKGLGYSGEKDDYLYYCGKIVKADSGSDYQVYEVNDKVYLVNESGKVQASNKCYKVDGGYRYEYAGGKIYEIDEDKERQGQITSGDTPTVNDYERIFELH